METNLTYLIIETCQFQSVNQFKRQFIDDFKQIQTNSNQFKPIQTNSNQFKPIQTNLKQFKPVETNSNQLKLIKIWLNKYDPIKNEFTSL